MLTDLMLFKLTDHGLQLRREFPYKIDSLKKIYRDAGVEMKAAYHSTCPFEGLQIVEAPEDSAIASLVLILESDGLIRARPAVSTRLRNIEKWSPNYLEPISTHSD
jgi:uncharacterized protein with GYD domain